MQLLDAARFELIEATEHYCAVSEPLAEDFLDEIEDAFKKIAEAPKRWPPGNWGTRRYILHKFPYAIVYSERGESPLVVAIAHGKRRPEYWKDRVAGDR